MAKNDFKPFATGNGANVLTQAEYEALAALASGFTSGKASSAQMNKAIRQATVIASVIAQFTADNGGSDVLDNGNTAAILASFITALNASVGNSLGSNFLRKANNLSDVINATTARQNLSAAKLGANSDITALSGLTTPLTVPQGGTGASSAINARANLYAAQLGANSDITSLSGLTTALSIPQGGTGAKSATDARANLFAAQLGANSDITSLSGLTTALSVDQGGTGAKTAAGARSNISAASSGANSDITSISGLTTALSVPQGGTGATSAVNARANLFAAQLGANSDITSLNGLTTALSIDQGGTGAKTAANARSNLQLNRFTQSDVETQVIAPSGRYVFRVWDNAVWGLYDSTNQVWMPLSVDKGGTGSTTGDGARVNISAAKSGANSDITSLSGLTTALSVTQGGTGAKTATAARANLFAGGIPTALNSAQGWWKCADTGRIFQHGKVAITSGSQLTFPIAFPNACFAVIMTDNDGYKDVGLLGATTTYASFTSGSGGTVTVGYLAIGY